MARRSCQVDGFFLRLLDFVPSKGAAAVLEAFFDESERSGGTFCVAGYAFAKPQAKKFAKEWRRLFPRGFHTVDFVHGRGVFSDSTQQERDALLREAVKTINTRRTVGVAVSCSVAEVQQHSPKFVRGFSHAYPICCHIAMTTLGAYLDEKHDLEEVVYTFEAGHQYEAEAREFIKNAVRSPEAKRSYRHIGDSFLPKSEAVPLEAADLLAWEWTKCYDETIALPIRRIRKSLRALFADPKQVLVRHLQGPPLKKFLDEVRRLGLLQIAKQRGEGPVTVGPI